MGRPSEATSRKTGKGGQLLTRVPLVAAANIQRCPSLLLEMTDEDMDFASDTGAIGRFFVTNDNVRLDIKGRQYETTLFPCCSALVLTLGKSEARVEAVIDEACRTSRRLSAGLEPEVLKGELNASFKVKENDVNARETMDDSTKDAKKGAGAKRARKGQKGKGAKKRKVA